jgi:hypothetical protein
VYIKRLIAQDRHVMKTPNVGLALQTEHDNWLGVRVEEDVSNEKLLEGPEDEGDYEGEGEDEQATDQTQDQAWKEPTANQTQGDADWSDKDWKEALTSNPVQEGF